MAHVHIIVVNYRTPDLTIDCLRSLHGECVNQPDTRVTVVDNHSQDGSAEKLAGVIRDEGWSTWCELLPLTKNDGFAAGNNAALRPLLAGPAPPDYFWLLNPDTIVRPGALGALVRFLDDHPRVGLAGSRLEDPDGTPQCSAFRFPGIASEFEGNIQTGPFSRLLRRHVVAPPVRDDEFETDWLAGASMMVRRAVWEDVGLMDEGYFLYFEETDFCLRARRKGWPCWYVPASRVVHLIGQSTGVTDASRRTRRRPAYWFESRRRYFRQNYGLVYAGFANASWLAGHVGWRIRATLQRTPNALPECLLGDFLRHNYLDATRRGLA